MLRTSIPRGGRARRWAILLCVLLWAYEVALMQARGIVAPFAEDLRSVLAGQSLWNAPVLPIGMALFLLIERVQSWPLARVAALLAALAAGASALHIVSGRALIGLFWQIQPLDAPLFAMHFAYWLHYYIAWAAILLALLYSLRAGAEQRLRAEAHALAHRIRMRSLRYQLNPHFLFNTLNSVAALVLDGRDSQAERMIRRLSSFLRRGIAEDPLGEVILDREIALQQDYLAIEQERFPDRLATRFEIPPELGRAVVPTFLLQPLIENSIKYAVAPSTERTTVTIAATTSDGVLVLSVTDDSRRQGDSAGTAPGTGIGLANTRQRLQLRYGDAASLSAERLARGFKAEIRLPLRFDQA